MTRLLVAVFTALFALPALAHDGVRIDNAYIVFRGGGAAAAYFTIFNHADVPERLTAVATDAAGKAELHESKADASGMMQMLPLDGIEVEAGGKAELSPGGIHVMLMGLTRPLEQGDKVILHLSFDHAGEVAVEAEVDNDRKPGAGGLLGGAMDHGASH